MGGEIFTRIIKSSSAAEVFITAVPKEPARTQSEIAELFAGFRKVLDSEKARILQERIFIINGAMDTVLAARKQAYGQIDDGVPPSFMTSSESRLGLISGVQVHAVAGAAGGETRRQGLRTNG